MAKYLYLIWQDVNDDYNTYDSAVVCARSEEEAKNIEVGNPAYSWTTPENVQIKKIGKADKNIEFGIIIASYNAG